MKPQGLSGSERVKRKKDFEKIFTSGTTLISSDKKAKVTFYYDKSLERSNIKAAFAVHKKAGKAFWRNRAKRLLRESYRLNKEKFFSGLNISTGSLMIVFSLYSINQKKNTNLYLKDIMPAVNDLMDKIKDRF